MSFQVSKRVAGDVILAELTEAINGVLHSSPDEEHDMIRLAADTAAKAIGDAGADTMVDVNLGGAISPNNKALTLSVTVTQLRPKTEERKGAQFAPWKPPGSSEPVQTDRPG